MTDTRPACLPTCTARLLQNLCIGRLTIRRTRSLRVMCLGHAVAMAVMQVAGRRTPTRAARALPRRVVQGERRASRRARRRERCGEVDAAALHRRRAAADRGIHIGRRLGRTDASGDRGRRRRNVDGARAPRAVRCGHRANAGQPQRRPRPPTSSITPRRRGSHWPRPSSLGARSAATSRRPGGTRPALGSSASPRGRWHPADRPARVASASAWPSTALRLGRRDPPARRARQLPRHPGQAAGSSGRWSDRRRP